MASVPEALVEAGLLASSEVTSPVSGLRSMSIALPMSMESLTGSRNSLMRSMVEVEDEAELVFVFVSVFVLVLMMPDIGVSCAVELGLWVGSVGCSGGGGCEGGGGCCWIG